MVGSESGGKHTGAGPKLSKTQKPASGKKQQQKQQQQQQQKPRTTASNNTLAGSKKAVLPPISASTPPSTTATPASSDGSTSSSRVGSVKDLENIARRLSDGGVRLPNLKARGSGSQSYKSTHSSSTAKTKAQQPPAKNATSPKTKSPTSKVQPTTAKQATKQPTKQATKQATKQPTKRATKQANNNNNAHARSHQAATAAGTSAKPPRFQLQTQVPTTATGVRPQMSNAQQHEQPQQHPLRQSFDGDMPLKEEFRAICDTLETLFLEAQEITEGAQANYIPELAAVNPDLFAIAAVSCEGETWTIGDFSVPFTMQSTCKPLLYCLAQSLIGYEKVHDYIGREPSGARFNAFVLDEDHMPHNPMINSGAIMSSAIILSQFKNKVDAYKATKDFVEKIAGHVSPITFDNSVYLSELGTASRNFALTHFMSEHSELLASSDTRQVLELYFSACSLSCDARSLATIAATMANGGVCPTTQRETMSPEMVQNTLSLMYNCGMYDYSGRFAFEVGIPAKSGVSGSLFLSIPGKFGIAVWSPRLDKKGNSVRGVYVAQRLVQEHPHLHVFGHILRRKAPQVRGRRRVRVCV